MIVSKLQCFVHGCKQLSCSFSDVVQPLVLSLVLCPPCLWVSKCKIARTRIEVCLSCGNQYEMTLSQQFSADFIILYIHVSILFHFTDTMQSLVFYRGLYPPYICVSTFKISKKYFAVFSSCINPSETVFLFVCYFFTNFRDFQRMHLRNA